MPEDSDKLASAAQLRLFAAAIYEIRVLLSGYLGSENEGDVDARLAAHLSHALHNDALQVLEGNGWFDVADAQKRIRAAERVVRHPYGDAYDALGVRETS
jgi:hypothetical protein